MLVWDGEHQSQVGGLQLIDVGMSLQSILLLCGGSVVVAKRDYLINSAL